jgi:flavin reductase (DIM6/NTAB) family NADH-FMN oxidoreductase RutF
MTASPALSPPTVVGGVRPEQLRSAMRRHGAGVAVITTRDAGGPIGFCASSLTSVSLEPPTVSFAVTTESASGRAWARNRHGLVHLLRSDQQAVAARFARSGPDKFDTADWRWGPDAQPLLADVLAWMLVSTRIRIAVGDHLLLVCDVLEVESGRTPGRRRPGPGPLIHHDGGFYGLAALPE